MPLRYLKGFRGIAYIIQNVSAVRVLVSSTLNTEHGMCTTEIQSLDSIVC